MVTIAFSTMEEGSYYIKLVDMMGRVVKSEIGNAGLGENTYILNLDGIAKAVYTVMLQKGDNIFKAKLVVE
jgi:type IX secretion system substrate protein